jgi:hexosaminidase
MLLDPQTAFRDAEARMLLHRLSLVEIGGLGAEKLQPEWCLQNEGVCPM